MAGNMEIIDTSVRPFTLFLVVSKADKLVIESDGAVKLTAWRRDWKYIGLRESPSDALEKAQRFERCSKETHEVLAVNFTPLGVQYFTTTPSDSSNRFKPLLHKVDYRGSDKDWGVWHFLCDLPLAAVDRDGNILIHSDWCEIL